MELAGITVRSSKVLYGGPSLPIAPLAFPSLWRRKSIKKTHWIQCEEQPGKQVYCSISGRVYVSGRISLVIFYPDFIWQKMWQGDIENKLPPV